MGKGMGMGMGMGEFKFNSTMSAPPHLSGDHDQFCTATERCATCETLYQKEQGSSSSSSSSGGGGGGGKGVGKDGRMLSTGEMKKQTINDNLKKRKKERIERLEQERKKARTDDQGKSTIVAD